MCHLLLFWTEAEDTLFSLARGKEKNSSLFSSGFMCVPVFLLALHLLLEFGYCKVEFGLIRMTLDILAPDELPETCFFN